MTQIPPPLLCLCLTRIPFILFLKIAAFVSNKKEMFQSSLISVTYIEYIKQTTKVLFQGVHDCKDEFSQKNACKFLFFFSRKYPSEECVREDQIQVKA